jgi:hypothetical protein
MLKIAKIAIVVNLTLASLFVYSNFSLWNLVNAEYPYLIANHWTPLGISAPHYVINNEGSIAVVQGIFWYFNYPFWIFWVLLVANLYFMMRISKQASHN